MVRGCQRDTLHRSKTVIQYEREPWREKHGAGNPWRWWWWWTTVLNRNLHHKWWVKNWFGIRKVRFQVMRTFQTENTEAKCIAGSMRCCPSKGKGKMNQFLLCQMIRFSKIKSWNCVRFTNFFSKVKKGAVGRWEKVDTYILDKDDGFHM